MRLAAVLNPDAVGLETENGNVIGDITLSGTLALLVFGGFLTGLIASVVWTTVSSWIPGTGLRRALLAAPVAVALGGVLLVQADNHDFVILTEDLLIVAMLLALVGTFGFALALLEEWLDRRMPRAGTDPRQYALTAGFLVLVGAVLFLPLTIGFYFSESACLCGVAPVPLAVPLIVTGVATVAWWAQRAARSSAAVHTGSARRSPRAADRGRPRRCARRNRGHSHSRVKGRRPTATGSTGRGT